ncbi:hypothetical protein [Brevundimonas sp.]|uniref:hypothetical protein n=1 Tax=Brevundimonas sp. TaxID=1871086 RepID=UPI003BA8A916
MRTARTGLVCALALAFSALAPLQAYAAEDAMKRDARERAPAALLGVWEADIAASTYSTPPRQHLRSFFYTAEGKLMVSFLTLGADGRQSAGHWAVQLDGTPGLEYFAANGSTPYAEIRLTPVDAQTFTVTNTYAGEQASTASYVLSNEGQTLTITRTPKSGNRSVVVYHRWGLGQSTSAN